MGTMRPLLYTRMERKAAGEVRFLQGRWRVSSTSMTASSEVSAKPHPFEADSSHSPTTHALLCVAYCIELKTAKYRN